HFDATAHHDLPQACALSLQYCDDFRDLDSFRYAANAQYDIDTYRRFNVDADLVAHVALKAGKLNLEPVAAGYKIHKPLRALFIAYHDTTLAGTCIHQCQRCARDTSARGVGHCTNDGTIKGLAGQRSRQQQGEK